MEFTFTVDRIEGAYAVCLADENAQGLEQLDILASLLPGIGESDVFTAELELDEKGLPQKDRNGDPILSHVTPRRDLTEERAAAAKEKLRLLLAKRRR